MVLVQCSVVRAFLVGVLIVAAPAFADVISEEVAACRNKAAGAACTAPEGPGTCVEVSVMRPDYSGGVPPKYRSVKMLSCVATAKGSAFSALPWLGVGLSFLALTLGLRFRPRPPGALPA